MAGFQSGFLATRQYPPKQCAMPLIGAKLFFLNWQQNSAIGHIIVRLNAMALL